MSLGLQLTTELQLGVTIIPRNVVQTLEDSLKTHLNSLLVSLHHYGSQDKFLMPCWTN